MLDDLRNGEKTVGIKQSMKAIVSGNVRKAFVAKDADSKIVDEFIEKCKEKGIEIEYIDNMKILGKVCGIDVGASVACLLKN